jgi:hypothetical protein
MRPLHSRVNKRCDERARLDRLIGKTQLAVCETQPQLVAAPALMWQTELATSLEQLVFSP